MDAPLTTGPHDLRPSIDMLSTFELTGAQSPSWVVAPSQLCRRFLEWVKMTTDPVYLHSPLLGRSGRFYFLLMLVALVCLDSGSLTSAEWAAVTVVPFLCATWSCVALSLLLHCRGKPMLSDWAHCSIALFGVVPPTEVLISLILCQSHPVQVALAGGFVLTAVHKDSEYCSGEGLYCPSRSAENCMRQAWIAVAVTVHCLDYTSRVRFIVDGVVAEWQREAIPDRCLFLGSIWSWLRWSLHPSVLSSPIAGRAYRHLSTTIAVLPLWSMWVIFRYQQFTWDRERLNGSYPALLLLIRDMGVAAAGIFLLSTMIWLLWHCKLLCDFIASDLLLGACVLVPWSLCVSQCAPLVVDVREARYNVSLRTFYDTNMTLLGLVLSGIHPAVGLLVYAACVLVGHSYPALPDEWNFELHGPLLLFGLGYFASYFSRLVVITKAMTRMEGNSRASVAISWRTQLQLSVESVEMEAKDRAQSAQLAVADADGMEAGELEEDRGRRAKRSSDTEVVRRQQRNRCPPLSPEAMRGHAASRRRWHPSIAVIRHGERADKCFESTWPTSQDARSHPFDPPITDQGVEQAEEVAARLRDFGEFHIVVSSPYLRCVQTGLVIAEKLDCALLIDGEVGEVFGPKVFGDVSCFDDTHTRKPWRSLKHLRKAAGLSEPGGPKSSDKRAFWCRALGSNPAWPESLKEARLRYTRCFLKYMKRAWDTRRNIVVVTHQHMVQACLRVLPASSFLEVDRVPYCGGMVAQLHRSVPACLFEEEEDPEGSDPVRPRRVSAPPAGCGPSEPTGISSALGSGERLHQARVQWWEVTLLGIEDVMRNSLRKRGGYQALQKKYEEELGPRWQDVKRVLGGLPDTPMEEHPVGISFSTSSWSEARTIAPSEASTKIFQRLTREDWSRSLQQTNEKAGGRSSPAGPDGALPISPALQQLRLRRISDAPQEVPAAPCRGAPSIERVFTVSSALARRRQVTK